MTTAHKRQPQECVNTKDKINNPLSTKTKHIMKVKEFHPAKRLCKDICGVSITWNV